MVTRLSQYEVNLGIFLRLKRNNIGEPLVEESTQSSVQVELARVQPGSIDASDRRGRKVRVNRPRYGVMSKHVSLSSDDLALVLDSPTSNN